MSEFIGIVAGIIAVIFIFAPHEYAHAFVAYRCGDPTAKMQGRLSLNPVKHLDPAGFILCAITGFGWAKPVPINPNNFHKYRKGLFLTAVAGVVTNYVIAFIAYPIFLAIMHYVYLDNYVYFLENEWLGVIVEIIFTAFSCIYTYGLGIVVFNLLPFYPLDGFRVLESCTREINPVRRFLRNYGMYILIILILESFLCSMLVKYAGLPVANYFDILGWVGWFAQNILGFPIKAFWNWIFGFPIIFI